MSVEVSVYTRQPPMSASTLKELAGRQGIEIRFLDFAGSPLGSDVPPDEPLSARDYVILGWPAADAETTEAVDRALRSGDKAEADRLGKAGKVGWCSIGCRDFDFAAYEAALREDLEYEDEDDREPMPVEVLDRMRQARTRYSFRSGTKPRQNAALLDRVARLIRDATDGFDDE